jgi:type IV fimbrial biogenesis protein FimT
VIAMPSQRGFTLMEAMVVVTIVGILAAFAFPAMGRFLTTQAVRSASYDLFADLIYARSEAIARGTSVIVTGVSGTDFKQGWSIDAVGAAANPIRTQAPRSSAIVFTASQNNFTFDRNGRASATMTFNIVPVESTPNDYMKRCVRLDPSGRPKSAEGACP